jgi:hypothetical protein
VCCASFCFGLMLYIWAIAAPAESSNPSSPDINVKVRAGHDPLASFLTIWVLDHAHPDLDYYLEQAIKAELERRAREKLRTLVVPPPDDAV